LLEAHPAEEIPFPSCSLKLRFAHQRQTSSDGEEISPSTHGSGAPEIEFVLATLLIGGVAPPTSDGCSSANALTSRLRSIVGSLGMTLS
jgi:hypothetical protein